MTAVSGVSRLHQGGFLLGNISQHGGWKGVSQAYLRVFYGGGYLSQAVLTFSALRTQVQIVGQEFHKSVLL